MPQRVPTREELQQILSSLLIACKESSTCGVPIARLDQEYKEQEGMRIPFRELGYPCLVDLLRSMSSSLLVGQRNGYHVVYPIVSERSAHISSLVAGQKVSHKRPRGGRRPVTRGAVPWYPHVTLPPRRLDSRTLGDVVRMAKNRRDGVPISEVLRYVQTKSNGSFELQDLMRQLREIRHEVVAERGVVYSVSGYQEPARPARIAAHAYDSRANNNIAETSVTSCISAAGNSDREDDEEDFPRNSARPATHDYAATSARDANGNVRNEDGRTKNGTTQAKEAKNVDERGEVRETEDNDKACEDYDSGDPENVSALISERTKFRLEKLVQKHPEGIWCADLPDLYEKEYKMSLNYEELGFGSVSAFAVHLPEVFHMLQPRDKGDFKLFDAKAAPPNLKPSGRQSSQTLAAYHNIYDSYGDQQELPVPVVLPSEASQRLIPDGVMTVGETVPQISVTELHGGENEYIDVLVVELFTPSFFWIQLLNRTIKFGQFMHDLHVFYTINAQKYAMPIIVMEKGLNCACQYDNKWHRGMIKTVQYDNTVTVLFYDYGTVQSYPPDEIHFLHRTFSSLPAQAIPCGLYNVKPRNTEKWSKSAAAQFSLQVMEKPLVATIGSIDTDNNSMLIGLTNTEGTEDFHINDWMVQNGLAVYGKMGDTVDMNDTTCDPINVDAEYYQALAEGLRKPPGQCLDTIVEERENSVESATEMRIRQLEERIELLERKNRVLESRCTDDEMRSSAPEESVPPPIPSLPKQSASAFLSKSETSEPLVNGGCNRIDEAVFADFEFLMSTPKPSIEKFDATAKLPSTTSSSYPTAKPTPSIVQFDVTAKLPDTMSSNFPTAKPTQSIVNLDATAKLPNTTSSEFPAPKPTPSNTKPNATVKLPNTMSSNFPTAKPTPSIVNLDATTKLRDSASSGFTAYPTTAFSADYVSQTTKYYPSINLTNFETSGPPPFSSPFNFAATLSSIPRTSHFEPRKGEPTLRKKFEGSLQSSVKNFFDRAEARGKSNLAAPSTSVLLDTNPFKNVLDKNDNYAKSREPAPKPWDYFTAMEPLNQSNPPVTKMVYEAAPITYHSTDKARSNTSSSSSLSSKRGEFVETHRGNVAASNESFDLSRGINRTEIHDEIPQQHNSRMLNERFSSEQSKNSNVAEDATARVSTNAKTKARTPPPLPPRPPRFDFNALPLEEQERYIAWLKAAEFSDNFADDESFASLGCKPKTPDVKSTVATRKPVALAIRRSNTPEVSIARDSSVKTDVTAKQSIATNRALMSDPVDSDACQFTKYQMSDNRTIHIFNMENEGWLATEEFAVAFMDLGASAMVDILRRMKVPVCYRTLSRLNNLRLFEKLERTSIGVRRDENNKIGDILHLTPLKSCSKILRKLHFVTKQEMKGKGASPEKSQVLDHLVMVIEEYGKFQRSLQAPSVH